MADTFPIYLAGEWKETASPLTVTNPYDGSTVGTTFLAGSDDLEQAIVAAQDAAAALRAAPTWQRSAWLRGLSATVQARRDHIIALITRECGKPIRDATAEFDRGVFTIDQAAEEANRIGGDVIPLDLMPSSTGRIGIVRRFPVGLIAGITPFNFPFNLAMHKLAPAIAAGCPIVLKPASAAPLTMLAVAEEIARIGLPAGAVSILPMTRETGHQLVDDPRVALLSFTGSPDVGWEMKARAGKKKVVLELGGNAGVYIDDDADIDFAVRRITTCAYAYAGQACISVQRVLIHAGRYDEVRDRLVAAAEALRLGDPMDPTTDLGPVIDEKAITRMQAWLQDAASLGARVVTGGGVQGRIFEPTVVENAPSTAAICTREVFAPLIAIAPVNSIDDGVATINDSRFGLQAGVFTNNLERAMAAYEQLEVGGVMINDVPTYRIDHMPYGGVKDSGFGREGLRYAIEEMTEPRLMVINRAR